MFANDSNNSAKSCDGSSTESRQCKCPGGSSTCGCCSANGSCRCGCSCCQSREIPK